MKQVIVKLFPSHLQPFASSALGDLGFNIKCIVELTIDIFGSLLFTGTTKIIILSSVTFDLWGEIFHSALTLITGLILAFLVYFGQKVYFPYLVGKFKDKNPKYKLYDDKKE
jgi:hypothetical protein